MTIRSQVEEGGLYRALKASLRTGAICLVVVAILSFYAVLPVAGQQIAIETGPTFVCNLMDDRAVAVGIGGADLGVSVVDGSELWMIFGDTAGTGPAGAGPGSRPLVGASSALESQLPFNCSSYSWLTAPGGKFYQPLHSAREAGMDESTVPAGAITLNDTIYIYSMQVNQWSSVTHAHGVLFKMQADGTFTELTRWPMDKLFVNTSPVAAELPDGTPAVFMATTAQYRHSPVYLAYVVPSEIGDPAAYQYLTGYDRNGAPVWSPDMAEAKPVPGFENVWVGELSFLYDAPLKSYLIMFKDYETNSFALYSSSTPYGPFEGPLTFFPCGTTSSRPGWMESGWGLCYGGYMLPDSFGADGHDLYFDISLWDPYTAVLMTMTLSTSSTAGSTSQITLTAATTSTPTLLPPTSISTESTETSVSSTQTSSGLMSMIQQYPLLILGGVVLLAAVVIAVALLSRRKPTPTQPTGTSVTTGMVYCGECGTQNPTANDFCENCGTKLH